MASIARNRAIDLVRKRTELSLEEESSALDVAADSPDPLARREMTEELKRLLECVGRLEAPINTIKTWLRRSMMDIRECLGL
jgi:RNA polymerase sigma-70 factor (ECF subfamily)